MIAIIKVGDEEEYVERVDAVVMDHPNEVRICKDGTEDRIVYVNGLGSTGRARTTVVVVP